MRVHLKGFTDTDAIVVIECECGNTREGSDVILINETPPESETPEAYDPCSWWRRGRVELPVQKAP